MSKRFAFKSNTKKQESDKSRAKSVSIKPLKSKEGTSKYILADCTLFYEISNKTKKNVYFFKI